MSTLAFDSLDFAWNLSSGAGENSSHLSNLPTRPNMTGSSYFSFQDDTTCGSCVSAICLMPSAVAGYVSESCLNELFPAEESLVWEQLRIHLQEEVCQLGLYLTEIVSFCLGISVVHIHSYCQPLCPSSFLGSSILDCDQVSGQALLGRAGGTWETHQGGMGGGRTHIYLDTYPLYVSCSTKGPVLALLPFLSGTPASGLLGKCDSQ